MSSQKEMFESLLEAVPAALMGIDEAGVLQFASRRAESLFGYDRDALVGVPLQALVPEALGHCHRLHREVSEAGAGEQPLDPDLKLTGLRSNGAALPVDVTLSPMDTGAGILVVATVHDMTGDPNAEKARSAFDAARAMMEASVDSLVAISPEGKITDANDATVKLTGVPREKLIGTSFSEYFTDPQKAEAIYQRVFTEGVVRDYPLTLRHRDGHTTFTEVRYNASVYRCDDEEVLGVVATARDVTEQLEDQKKITSQKTRELERLAELELFQRLTVGRELKMIELKKEIEYLKGLGPAGDSEPQGQHPDD
jgi:PAS domain S-box-containing protein